MGYFRQDAVIAILDSRGEDTVLELRQFLDSVPEALRCYFLGPVEGLNGYTTFLVAPDGSKEGWEHSNRMDDLRSRFVEIVRKAGFHQLVHLQFGGDDRDTRISYTSECYDELDDGSRE